ncbi:hypothetical protein Hanom_Chr08g00686011 [Helianthus anomalus]
MFSLNLYSSSSRKNNKSPLKSLYQLLGSCNVTNLVKIRDDGSTTGSKTLIKRSSLTAFSCHVFIPIITNTIFILKFKKQDKSYTSSIECSTLSPPINL